MPRIDRVAELVEQTHRAGTAASLTTDGVPAELPAAVELAGYRVVQEALTNVRTHAAGGRAAVTVRWHEVAVELSVTSHGGRAGEATSGGRGLAGMAERVRVFGSTFRAGPDGDGGFAVHAVLPKESGPGEFGPGKVWP